MRAQCVFEDAATRCAIGMLWVNLSYEQKQTEERMRSKMIEMSGDAPRDRGREDVPVHGLEGSWTDDVATRATAQVVYSPNYQKQHVPQNDSRAAGLQFTVSSVLSPGFL